MDHHQQALKGVYKIKMASKKLLRLPAVETATGYKRSTIYRLIQQGKFPPPISLGARASAWVEDEIDGWIEGRIAATTRLG